MVNTLHSSLLVGKKRVAPLTPLKGGWLRSLFFNLYKSPRLTTALLYSARYRRYISRVRVQDGPEILFKFQITEASRTAVI